MEMGVTGMGTGTIPRPRAALDLQPLIHKSNTPPITILGHTTALVPTTKLIIMEKVYIETKHTHNNKKIIVTPAQFLFAQKVVTSKVSSTVNMHLLQT